jgi:uncharacterized lipoprotein YddW (UPF0748 family)
VIIGLRRPKVLSLTTNPNLRIARLAVVLLVAAGAPRVATALDEFRGMWVTRFEWPQTTEAGTKTYIDQVMTDLASHNFNAVLFQVRGQADVLYPSPDEPWSELISPTGADPGWDPLAYAIQSAHNHGLEFHAYFNTHVCYQNKDALQAAPSNTNHLYYKHCNAADPAHRDWLIHNNNGTPVQWDESNYVWMAPGVPAMQAYVRKQVMYLVNTYNVDGVHFDRIRTPKNDTTTRSWSHDPISNARSAIGAEGNPDNLAFPDWSRDQITRFVRDVYAQIQEVKPRVKLSCSPLGLYRWERYTAYGGYPQTNCGFQYGFLCCYQDAQGWLAAGAMDFIVPMIYWGNGGSKPDYDEVLPDWVSHNAGRHVYGGQAAYKAEMTLAEMTHQVEFTRQIGGQGNVPFSYTSFTLWDGYIAPGGVYEQPANVPPMPWKDNPTAGIIVGNITTGGAPVIDAHIRRNGSTYTALSGADGLYCFLLVPPGTYTLTVTKNGLATRQVTGVAVAAGQVSRLDITLGPDFDGDGDVDLIDFAYLQACFNGPNRPAAATNCLPADLDQDADVDLADFGVFQGRFNGPNQPPND